MGFLQSMGLGQFAGGGTPWGNSGVMPYEWMQQQKYPQGPDPNDPRPRRGDFQPWDQFQTTLREWEQRQPPGSIEPGRPGAWRPVVPPQQQPGMPPMGQGQLPPVIGPSFNPNIPQLQFQQPGMPPGQGTMGQQMPWQQGFNPTQLRHNAWAMQHGGMAPLSQYQQFGQGGGWGGLMGGLGSAFGMRR